MSAKYRYAIVIPHYRLIELLPRALASIPDRPDIQILVVDDNSGIDESAFAPLNVFQRAHCRFVFTKESKGAGYVRNVGLKHVQAEWVLFLDADDFFEQGAFDLFDRYAHAHADMVYFSTRSVYSDSLLPSSRFSIYNAYVHHARVPEPHRLHLLRAYHVVPVAKMIRFALIDTHSIRFDEVRWGNDVFFATQIGVWANNVLVDQGVVYVVTDRANSLVKNLSPEAMLCRYEVALRANQFLREAGRSPYQNTLLFHLKRIAQCGVKHLLHAIRMGFRYKGFNKYTLYLSSRTVKAALRAYTQTQR